MSLRKAMPLLLAASVAVAGPIGPRAPEAAALPALAASLHERIRGTEVEVPGGGTVALGAILDASRLERCLKTVGEALAWPATWLVVQDRGRSFDLVMRLHLADDGSVATPDVAFATPRQEWDDAALERNVREVTGKKPPRERSRNLVIQSFSPQVVTTYVYELPKAGKDAKGLMAMLPEGSLLRESHLVDLGDDRRHTLAIILIRPRFVPSACADAGERSHGHEDAGGVLLVLAGEAALEDTLDLTEDLKGNGSEARLPRFACTDEDPEPTTASLPYETRFAAREPVKLLRMGTEGSAEVRASILRTANGDPRGAIPVKVTLEAGKARLSFADGR